MNLQVESERAGKGGKSVGKIKAGGKVGKADGKSKGDTSAVDENDNEGDSEMAGHTNE